MRLSKVMVLLGLLVCLVGSVLAGSPAYESVGVKPPTVSKFKPTGLIAYPSDPYSGAALASEASEYAGPNGSRVRVERFKFRQESKAYEVLSLFSAAARASDPKIEIVNGIGTAGFATDKEITFFKGIYVVSVKNTSQRPADLSELAHAWSEVLEKGEGDIPVLIKHLPSPGEAQKSGVYLSSFFDLQRLPFQNGVYSAIQPDGNADAAFATYGQSKVLVIEFHTPQLATDNDKRIIARIQELWKLGQVAPTAYRRVGNYSVFVFDAPDEQTAKQLIDQVKYEQVVQWLGENPNILREAEKRYVNTTLGVLVAVLKASGYALVLCLGMGGLIGGLLFTYRRAQQRDETAFSDAGGMLRLNLDEMTPETNPSRLLRERN